MFKAKMRGKSFTLDLLEKKIVFSIIHNGNGKTHATQEEPTKAANTTIFLHNKLPTRAMKNQTPFEAWYGYKQSLNFLKVKHDKLDKAIQGVFVGYNTISKAYKVFQPQTGSIVINMDRNEEWQNEIVDDVPVRGTRLLFDVYQRCNIALCEPAGFEETKLDQNWKVATKEELYMIEKKTWQLVDKRQDTKLNVDGSINKHKARLVEEIYVEQFEGCVKKGEEDKVYLLKKALYGLKQAPRAWYSKIDNHLLSLGFIKIIFVFTLYIKHCESDILIISLYVDDLLVMGNNVALIDEFKLEMMKVFEMIDLGLMTYFLGMEIMQSQDEVFICQKKYAKQIVKKFHMEDCKSINTPMNQKEKFSKEDGAKKVDEAYFRSLIGVVPYSNRT
ncbi:hypothetical protein CR513_19224, partial [Mucuna pruriens]